MAGTDPRELARPDTLDVMIADVLRREIAQEALSADDQLNVRELAARFHVSTTPVLAALKRLEVEGYLLVDSRRGVRIVPLSSEDLEELIVMRVALERFATGLAVPAADEAVHKRMRRLLAQMEPLVDGDESDHVELMELDRRFHLTLYEATGRQSLLTKIDNLRTRTQAYLFQGDSSRRAHRQKTQVMHTSLLEAVVRRDVDAAVSIIEQHIRQTQARYPRTAERASAAP